MPSGTTLAIGITGGIASGKSEVCRIFATLGAKVLHADSIAKEIIATNPQIEKNIRRIFGAKAFLPDGSLERKRVARMIFTDDEMKADLNAVVHPSTLERIQSEITL